MLPEYPCQSNLVIAPRLRPLAERPGFLRRCALFATGGEPNEVAPTSGAMERVATPRAWGNAVEKLRSRRADLKQRGAAAKITAWTKAVEKVRSKQRFLRNKQQMQPAAGTLNRLSRCSKARAQPTGGFRP